MNIAITGHTGFIGSKLKSYFEDKGHNITGIGRSDFTNGNLSTLLNGQDVVINLAGAPILKRWTRSYSREIWNSRITTTHLLVDAFGQLPVKPKIFISASGVNIYNEKGIHAEDSPSLDMNFLGTLCQEWEREALKAKVMINTYIIRLGVVLGRDGGALVQLARPFRLGAGGKIGSGEQMFSWIHISDLISALDMIIEKRPDETVFNMTAPQPVSNATLSTTIAKVLNKPNFLTIPPFALKILYGEGATVILSGQHVIPENLVNSGYVFKFPEIEKALEDLL